MSGPSAILTGKHGGLGEGRRACSLRLGGAGAGEPDYGVGHGPALPGVPGDDVTDHISNGQAAGIPEKEDVSVVAGGDDAVLAAPGTRDDGAGVLVVRPRLGRAQEERRRFE